MLDNPKSVKILAKTKKYYTELRKFKNDADQWLNKTNKQSSKIKEQVTRIFAYFSEICLDETKNQEYEESKPTEKGQILTPGNIFTGEPDEETIAR